MNFIKHFQQFRNKKNNQIVPENWHEDFIVHLAKIMQPKLYVELGLYKSAVFNRILPYAEKLIGVDKDLQFKKYMTVSPKTIFKCMTTNEFAKELKKQPIKIDMLFIDADHSSQSVEKDFKQF